MAFHTNSRYVSQPTVDVVMNSFVTVKAVKLRALPSPSSSPAIVREQDRLDLLAYERFRDGTLFWHITDANTELEAARLCHRLTPDARRMIQIPRFV